MALGLSYNFVAMSQSDHLSSSPSSAVVFCVSCMSRTRSPPPLCCCVDLVCRNASFPLKRSPVELLVVVVVVVVVVIIVVFLLLHAVYVPSSLTGPYLGACGVISR